MNLASSRVRVAHVGSAWSPTAPLPTELLQQLAARLTECRYGLITCLPSPGTLSSPQALMAELRALLGRLRRSAPAHRLFDVSPLARCSYRRFQRHDPQTFALFQLWFLNSRVARRVILQSLGTSLVNGLLAAGILRVEGRFLVSQVRLVPYKDWLIVTDPFDRMITDFTYLGSDSIELADFVEQRLSRRRFEQGLDLCTGTGILTLVLAQRCRQVVGIDINPRALGYARVNALLNRLPQIQVAWGDITRDLPFPGRFEVIVANPPFRFLPDALKERHRDGFGGTWGMDMTQHVLRIIEQRLADRGVGIVLTVAPVVKGENRLWTTLSERFAGKPFAIELLTTDLVYPLEHHAFYRAHHVSHFLPCVCIVTPSATPRLVSRDHVAHRSLKRLAIWLRQRLSR